MDSCNHMYIHFCILRYVNGSVTASTVIITVIIMYMCYINTPLVTPILTCTCMYMYMHVRVHAVHKLLLYKATTLYIVLLVLLVLDIHVLSQL